MARRTAEPTYSRTQRALEVTAIAAFGALAAWNFATLHSVPAWRLAACGLGGWIAADFLSGLLHWALDRFGDERTPLIGRDFIRPFREHHVDPATMTRHDFVETNGASCLAAAPLLVAASLLGAAGWMHSLLVFTALGVLAANQSHKWAHTPPQQLPALVRWLQRCRLVLHPDAHRLHHRPPYDRGYCAASGWCNPLLNALLAR